MLSNYYLIVLLWLYAFHCFADTQGLENKRKIKNPRSEQQRLVKKSEALSKETARCTEKKKGLSEPKAHLSLPKNVPDADALSHYGNPDIYFVEGQAYEVFARPEGYQERGFASWYGGKFHHRKTSSGEIYDMYLLTAAHRTLPLPSYVKVTHLGNLKTVIVKVNDRGPFYKGRIIDLSYAAAKQLGMLTQGTARVKIEVLSYLHKEKALSYYLQAGVFQSKESAFALKNKLKNLVKEPVRVLSSKGLYRVNIGPFNDKMDLRVVKNKLVSQGFHDVFSFLAFTSAKKPQKAGKGH